MTPYRKRLVICAAVSISIGILTERWLAQPVACATEGPVSASARQVIDLDMVATSVRWYGRPLFKVTNRTREDLRHVTLETQSDDLLPVLAIGTIAPTHWPARNTRLLRPPFDLPAGASIWFAGTHGAPFAIELFWVDEGKPHHELVTAGDAM